MEVFGEMGAVVAMGITTRLEDLLMLLPPPGNEWVHALVGCLGHVTRCRA
jgi:hypothetical protein